MEDIPGTNRPAQDNRKGEIAVASRLTNPHPVIAETKRRYAELKPRPNERYFVRNLRALHVSIAPPSLNRALLLADALFKAAEARGHTVGIAEDTRGAYICAEGQRVFVEMREHFTRTPHVPTKAELRDKERYAWTRIPEFDPVPTGELTFEISNAPGGRARWSEGKRWHQEERIGAVLAGIEAAARALLAQHEEWERRQRARQEAEERRIKEAESRTQLERQLSAWREARDIRSFVADMRGAGDTDPAQAILDDERERWLDWALHYADRIDPVAAHRQSLAE